MKRELGCRLTSIPLGFFSRLTAIASVNKLLLTYLQVPALQCEDEPGDVSDTEEPTTLEPVDLGAILLEDPENEDDEIRLPTHRRFAAHTLNLLAAADTVSVPTWSAGPRSAFTKTKVKAQALWNAQNRRPAFAAAIKDSFGRKFITPTVTRCNSLYDSSYASSPCWPTIRLSSTHSAPSTTSCSSPASPTKIWRLCRSTSAS